VLINPAWIQPEVFTSRGIAVLPVPDPVSEPHSANVLSFRVDGAAAANGMKEDAMAPQRLVVAPAHYPRVAAMLNELVQASPMDGDAQVRILTVQASELAKAEGALTCCSLMVLK
jgi:hypothetical protein